MNSQAFMIISTGVKARKVTMLIFRQLFLLRLIYPGT